MTPPYYHQNYAVEIPKIPAIFRHKVMKVRAFDLHTPVSTYIGRVKHLNFSYQIKQRLGIAAIWLVLHLALVVLFSH